ncbi:NADH-quinone oxidoreductase subunit L [Pirellulimonas nuda]|uniref:NADH-quinone oxidoreductase subunit L n=1 Tax=Pirellulimonas nuda TaxID=2528009 RepID=A0A518DGF3_9BACT|nr:NADH-quinone oxidoreductase subunit L [Pirellulimonas nuda]QDU90555.1 NADH-quinone oxidoreductase subunit L [Pirellulimonas nuda]
MPPETLIPVLLIAAWLLPLAAFLVVWLGFSALQGAGKGRVSSGASRAGGWLSVGAILASLLLSVAALGVWLGAYGLTPAGHPPAEGAGAHAPTVLSAPLYTLAQFGALRLSIDYYVDALTVLMFVLVTLMSACVHVYSLGYMHDELSDVTDREVPVAGGRALVRPGRFHRFFQHLSLFSFSMLGLVIAGNLLMVFAFWELVGICSWLLIGFYFERPAASTAANKAFIVNRIGDFGFLVGLMALWGSLGTLAFADAGADGPGVFSQLRTAENHHALAAPPAMQHEDQASSRPGYWLLCAAGLGIFCGCVGKSAQFPLHVWLPDAMEGPTPVSALVHSATMVAAGVYLVGRCYPIFTPEVLLVIAYTGCVTLLLAATIAVTATDIKRVLAYSTISQLGYMMLALGVGGWVAGLFHLVTHALFKGLLFLGAGSVIHAVGTNEMPLMGGLRRKMPITSAAMLVGALAIVGAGLPLTSFGLAGFFSKDAILEQALSFAGRNPAHALLMIAPALGAAITGFYMFRLWLLTFAGQPRDVARFRHAHESPRTMTGPLILLAVLAVVAGGVLPGGFSVPAMLESARPLGTHADQVGVWLPELVHPGEHAAHAQAIRVPAGLIAFGAAALGVLLAAAVYLWRWLNPAEVAHTFRPVYALLAHAWWFDEIYAALVVRPVLWVGAAVAWFDRRVIDGVVHALAWLCRAFAALVGVVLDRGVIDGGVDGFARTTWSLADNLRGIQTGSLRTYVTTLAAGAVALFAVALAWKYAFAG